MQDEERKLVEQIKRDGPIWTGQGYIELCPKFDGLHKWIPIQHQSPTYHTYRCIHCGKTENIDSS